MQVAKDVAGGRGGERYGRHGLQKEYFFFGGGGIWLSALSKF
jgi:hypothetical protein